MSDIRRAIERAKSLLVEPGNIDLDARPVVLNDDGSYSTVESFSFEDDDGSEVLIPMVAPDGSMFSSQDAAIGYYKRSGQHLGKFKDWRAADIYAEALHNAQDTEYRPIAEALMAARSKVSP